MFDLSGKVALVTGSSRGIGRAIVEAMAAAGARVVVSSRHAEACAAVAGELNAAGREAIALACNVSDRAAVEGLVDAACERLGGLDVVVGNAATNPHFGPLADVDDAAWDKTLRTNVLANLWLANRALPRVAERGGGALILVSSIAALRGNTLLGPYGVSKAAEISLARSLALEWGPKRVRVNCIAPGLVRTDFARALWEDPKRLAARERATPLGRIGEPEDVAGAAVFLASRAGAWITGQCLVVDGGVTVAET